LYLKEKYDRTTEVIVSHLLCNNLVIESKMT
jgi:hypothetical protein